jgi:hypothetical protein
MNLTTHLLLVPRLKMSGAVPPPPPSAPHALMAWTGRTSPFMLSYDFRVNQTTCTLGSQGSFSVKNTKVFFLRPTFTTDPNGHRLFLRLKHGDENVELTCILPFCHPKVKNECPICCTLDRFHKNASTVWVSTC